MRGLSLGIGLGICHGGGASPAIALSANSVAEDASIGTSVGALSVGSHPSGSSGWTFAITSQTPSGKLGIATPARLVSTRTGFPSRTVSNTGTTGGGTATQYQEIQSVILTSDAQFLSMRFANTINNSTTLSQLDVGLASLTLRCAVQLASGNPKPCYLASDGTTRDAVMAAGDAVDFIVDLGSVITAGTRVWIIKFGTYASVPARWPTTDVILSRADEFNEFGTALSDRTGARWTSGSRPNNYAILPPIAIWASLPVSAPSVAIIGDSISSAGNNDGTFGDGIGWVQRGLNTAPRVAWTDNGAQGMALSAFIGSSTQKTRRIDALASTGATHIICPLGTNDLSGGSTAAQLQTNMQSLDTYAAARGLKVIPCTLPPRTDSTNTVKYGADSASVWGYRQTYNAWVRTDPLGNGYFDAAAYMQDATNTDLWRTDLGTPTSDGIHPSTVVHTAVTTAFAARIAAGLFAAPTVGLVTAATLDYETSTSLSALITASKTGQTDLTRTFTINVTNVFEAANLAALALDDTDVPQSSSATINITSATSGSTITLLSGSLPAGMTLNSGARTITGTPTTQATYNFTLRETLADSANSPRDTALSVVVSAPSVGNQLQPANRAAAQTMLSTTAVAGDVIDTNGAWYTPDAGGVFTITRAMGAGAGITFIGNMAEKSQFVASGKSDMYIEFVNCYGSADANGGANNGYSFNFLNCTHFSIHGSYVAQGEFGIMLDGCSNVDVGYNTIVFHRDDHIRVQNSGTGIKIHHNYVTDGLAQGRIYWDPTGAGNPDFWTFHGAPYLTKDVNHIDPISFYTNGGTFTDCEVTDNIVDLYGQGLWMVDNITYVRLNVSRNDITASLTNAISIGGAATHVTVSGNIVRTPSNPAVGYSNPAIFVQGAGPWATDGLNSFPGGTTINYNGIAGYNLISGSANSTGSVTPVNAPAFIATTSNISNLATLRANRPAYTKYSGVVSPDRAGEVLGATDIVTTAAAGDWLTAFPPPVKKYSSGIEATYGYRWKEGASVVQGPTYALSGAKFQANNAATVTYEIDFGDGVWRAGAAVTVGTAPGVGTFVTGVSNVTYTNSDLTVTKSTASGYVGVFGTSSRTWGTAGKFWCQFTPTQQSGGATQFGFFDGTKRVMFTGTQWVDQNGSFYASGSPGGAVNGTDKYTLLLDMVANRIWIHCTSNGWLAGGDPNSGGAGTDLTALGYSGTLTPLVIINVIGDSIIMNDGQAAAGITLPSGSVSF